MQRVQRFLTLAEMTVAHKYPTSAKLYLAQLKQIRVYNYNTMEKLKQFEALQPESRVHSVQFNEEERIRYPVLREEAELLVQELASRCNN